MMISEKEEVLGDPQEVGEMVREEEDQHRQNIDEIIKKIQDLIKKFIPRKWFQRKTHNFRFSYFNCNLGI